MCFQNQNSNYFEKMKIHIPADNQKPISSRKQTNDVKPSFWKIIFLHFITSNIGNEVFLFLKPIKTL